MLENYLDIITNIENYVDGILVTDANADIVYIHKFSKYVSPYPEHQALGKNLFQIYPEMNPLKSTIIKALQTGEATLSEHNILKTADGKTFEMIDDTFPIKENGNIIGAVSIARSPIHKHSEHTLELLAKKALVSKDLFTTADIIGRSEKIQLLRQQIHKIAQTSSSLLIYGDTGTGKEMVAQSVHSGSLRRGKPFITQNCAAIPATLLESIFFGTVKGSYTGAENRAGIFEIANGGSIFLDEINSMDFGLQAKLLRILEEKKVTRIGSAESVKVDVRIIAAINKPPIECIKNGTLRADLFYRLGSITLNIPQLKERGEDISILTNYFIDEYRNSMNKNIVSVSKDVMSIFYNYSWPGNVRELKNVIEAAFNLCASSVINTSELPSYLLAEMESENFDAKNSESAETAQWHGSLKKSLDAYEKELIINAIKSHKTLSAAAEYLGISRQSLNQKINKYQLPVAKTSLFLKDAD